VRAHTAMRLGTLALLGGTLAACGSSSSTIATPDHNHIVRITMQDERFEPNHLAIRVGETVTLRFTNRGALTHEAYVGTMAQQVAHESEMSSSDSSTMTTMGETRR